MTTDTRNIAWAVAVLIATLAFFGATWIVPDFGGFDPDQYPVQQIDPPIVPAGYAFAIWGVIYIWLLVSASFGLIRRATAGDWADMRPALSLSLVVGASWLPVAKQSALAASVLIWAMLIPALLALFRAPLLDRWWARAPLGLYAGWLSAASFVALGTSLAGWGVMGEVQAALLCIAAALVLAALVQVALEGVPEYGIAATWAFVGIVVGNLSGGAFIVLLAALAGAVVMALLALRAATLTRA